MGAVETPGTTLETVSLDRLASVARRALAADVLVIEARDQTGASTWPGSAGATGSELAGLQRCFASIGDVVAGAPRLHVPVLGEPLAGQGFGSGLWAALEVEGQRVGTIHALRHARGAFANDELIAVFAGHAAVSLADGRRPHPADVSGRPEERYLLNQLVLSARSFSELSRAVNEQVALSFDADLTGIMVWDEHREVLQMVPGSFKASEELAASYQVRSNDPYSNAARVFATGEPYLSNDAAGDVGILQSYVRAFGIRNTLSMPLIVGEQPIGVLHIANKRGGFKVEDVHRAESVASGIAAVVELAMTVFRLRRGHALASILTRLAVAIASGQNVNDFLQPALLELCDEMEANMIGLVFGSTPPIQARRGPRNAALEDMLLAEAQHQLRVGFAVGRPREPGDPGWTAVLIPVRLGAQSVGAVAALRTRGTPFTSDERRALEQLASLAALAYTSERYQRQRAEFARHEERDRIADDLHDDVAQMLFSAHLALDLALEVEGLNEQAVSLIERARGLVVEVDGAIRAAIYQLASPPPRELTDRLSGVVRGIEQTHGLPVRVEVEEDAAAAARRLGAPVMDALLRVAREALINAAKHAGPCRATVTLEVDRLGLLVLRIIDDGLGRMHNSSHHGLASLRKTMEAHGGALQVQSAPAGGFRVTATIQT